MVQAARRVVNDPHLFAFQVVFDNNFLHLGPDNSGYTTSADYESPCDLTQYLEISRWLNLKNYPADSARLLEAPFLPQYSCGGTEPGIPYVAKPDPESESKHPPIKGWTVDLAQLWRIAKNHDALFANGLELCRITTAARLKESDSRPQCGGGSLFDSLSWNGVEPSGKRVKRLVNEHGQRAVIEMVEEAQPNSPGNRCAKGHYLIVDAGSGTDLEGGVYFSCVYTPA